MISLLLTLCHCPRSDHHFFTWVTGLVILNYLLFCKLAINFHAFESQSRDWLLNLFISSVFMNELKCQFFSDVKPWLTSQVNLALLFLSSYSTLYVFSICQNNSDCTVLAYFYICFPRILKLFEIWDFLS